MKKRTRRASAAQILSASSVLVLCIAAVACDGSAQAPTETRTSLAGLTSNGSCNGNCGGQSADASCWCDSQCAHFGDCCADKVSVCDAKKAPASPLSMRTLHISTNCAAVGDDVGVWVSVSQSATVDEQVTLRMSDNAQWANGHWSSPQPGDAKATVVTVAAGSTSSNLASYLLDVAGPQVLYTLSGKVSPSTGKATTTMAMTTAVRRASQCD